MLSVRKDKITVTVFNSLFIGMVICVGLFLPFHKTHADTFTSCPSGGGTGISVAAQTITITAATTF